ncbi:MAG TPA: hypothetical protein VJ372_01150 [Pyrinomonadaceae bacterium]|jgi:hypothetical protein|nr:hypothetical protein [Pyrinomonadaceae bacterium]
MKSKNLSAQRPGNRSNGSASIRSSDDLTKRNVDIIKQLEDAALNTTNTHGHIYR